MMLKSLSFLTFLISVQCRHTTRDPSDGTVQHRVPSEAKNASNIPPDGYIAYGRQAQIGEFPWMSVVETVHYDDGMLYPCGGSLISDRHVITAAHCVVKARSLEETTIIVGEYLTNTYPKDCDMYNRCTMNHRTHAAQVTWHNPFDPNTMSNDIAVLRLQEHVNTDSIRPINLPPFDIDNSMYEDAPLTVAGWGKTEHSNNESQILLKTEVSLKTREQCYRIYNYSYPEGHLCAGSSTYKDSCNGDSGGPIMMYYQNKYYISGVVSFSWSRECGVKPASYYTNVFKYVKWINWAMQR